MNKIILAVTGLSIITGAFVSCKNAGKDKEQSFANEDTIPVKLYQLSNASGNVTIPVSGMFTTDDETLLSFKTGGIIQHIYVKEGDAIHAGQVLATINVTEINAQAEQAQLGYEKAKRDYDRAMSLMRDSVATLEQVQNAKTALGIATQQLNAAKFNQGQSDIRAPRDGFVLKKIANDGQVVGPGAPVFQVNGARSAHWLLRAGISNKEWAAIHVGDTATVQIESLPGKNFDAHVARKSEGVDQTGAFTIDIQPSGEKPSGVAYGMFGKAVVYTQNRANIKTTSNMWSMPYDALLDADGSTGYVFVTNDNKTAHRIKVTVGGMDKDNVLISDGLQNVSAVIIAGSAYLTEGSKIKMSE